MLMDIFGTKMKGLPRESNWSVWKDRLNDEDFDIAKRAMNAYIDKEIVSKSKEPISAAKIAGKDWTGGPYQSLYHAVNKDTTAAAFFFGLILWQVFQERDEEWNFIGDQIKTGMEYFLHTN